MQCIGAKGLGKNQGIPSGSFACFFQAFAAQLIADIHSSYLTDSGKALFFILASHFTLRPARWKVQSKSGATALRFA